MSSAVSLSDSDSDCLIVSSTVRSPASSATRSRFFSSNISEGADSDADLQLALKLSREQVQVDQASQKGISSSVKSEQPATKKRNNAEEPRRAQKKVKVETELSGGDDSDVFESRAPSRVLIKSKKPKSAQAKTKQRQESEQELSEESEEEEEPSESSPSDSESASSGDAKRRKSRSKAKVKSESQGQKARGRPKASKPAANSSSGKKRGGSKKRFEFSRDELLEWFRTLGPLTIAKLMEPERVGLGSTLSDAPTLGLAEACEMMEFADEDRDGIVGEADFIRICQMAKLIPVEAE